MAYFAPFTNRLAGTPPPQLPHPLSRSFPAIVPKRDRTLTLSATIRHDVNHMQTITVITLLALLTISGAVISDRILTSGEAQTVVAVRF